MVILEWLSLRKSRTPRNFSTCWRMASPPTRPRRSPRRVNTLSIQPCWSRRTLVWPSSRLEGADTSTPSRLTSPTSSPPSRVDSARMSRRSRLRRESLPKRPRSDPSYLNSHPSNHLTQHITSTKSHQGMQTHPLFSLTLRNCNSP